jgi:drug/metabolite transporter (DMT)-like permease
MLRSVDPLQATAWSVLGGTLFPLPFGALEVATSPPPVVSIPVILGVVYSGAFAAGIANVLVFNAIRFVGPTRVTASQFLVPAGAVILGALFLAEPVGLPQVAGGAIIVFGVWLTRRRALLPAPRRARPG